METLMDGHFGDDKKIKQTTCVKNLNSKRKNTLKAQTMLPKSALSACCSKIWRGVFYTLCVFNYRDKKIYSLNVVVSD